MDRTGALATQGRGVTLARENVGAVLGTFRAAGLFLLGWVVVACATGTLYWARGPTTGWPGPMIRDVLPLDELPGHDGVRLLVFLGVWIVAVLLLAEIARVAGLTRVPAAVLLGAGVWAWLYLTQAFSIYVVRQVPPRDALHAALTAHAIYLPALLAAGAGALLATPLGERSSRIPRVMAWLVAAAGVSDILQAMTPSLARRLAEFERFAPQAVPPAARALVVPVGVALVLIARGLARRNRRAWQLAVALLGLSAFLHILRGLEFEAAAVTLVLTFALVAYRHHFSAPGDPTTRGSLWLRLAVFLGVIYAYGILALLAYRAEADRPFSLGFALDETTRALTGLHMLGSPHLSGEFSEWFPVSVMLLGAVGVGAILAVWLAPWRYRHHQLPRDRARARALVRAAGRDSLAPFTLRADKSYFFAPNGRAFLAYRTVAGTALVSGDPVGEVDEDVTEVLRRFLDFAGARGWRVGVLGASDDRLDTYRSLGLHALYHGDEAVIDTACFSLEGRPIRKVRQSVSRLRRAGYGVEFLHLGEVGPDLRADLEAIARTWQGERQRGFAMEFDSLFDMDGEDALVVLGREAEGAPVGFLHFGVCHAGSTLSLSTMPRRSDTPNGFNEWLVAETVGWAREHGFATVSLNFSPFGSLLAAEGDLSPLQRLEREALLALKDRMQFQLDNLRRFNEQFLPRWRRRYIVYERRSDLPRVGLAALSAEGYLPFGPRRAA